VEAAVLAPIAACSHRQMGIEAAVLPPIAACSALLAAMPKASQLDSVYGTPPREWESMSLKSPVFDVCELEMALAKSQQITGGAGGLRRTVSAPQALDSLANLDDDGEHDEYLPPSGGPLRRVASSMGMRRSPSFSWSPGALHDFERAISSLKARRIEVSAVAVLRLMRHHPELKLPDIEKQISKTRRAVTQDRLNAQLQNDEPSAHEATGTRGFSSPVTARPTRLSGAPAMPRVAEEEALHTGGTEAAAAGTGRTRM